MVIWFDISNSPHVNMFYHLIKELESEGNEVIITSRPLANTVQLLDQKGLNHTIIGSHYGKNIFKKIFGYPIRVAQLYFFLKKKSINLAVSQSSFHSPLVAFLLSVPSIYTNDNEHAKGNIIGFLLSTKILVPGKFSFNRTLSFLINKDKILYYPGVKEGIYLWIKEHQLKSLQQHKVPEKVTNIYIRPEPQTAQYYNGDLFFLDALIVDLQEKYQVTILARNKDQYAHYTQKKFFKSYVPKDPLSFDEIALNCQLFIGAGGSMTREFAILGIPTISVYQASLLAVDKVLINLKLMHYDPNLSIEKVEKELTQNHQSSSSELLLLMGKSAYDLFKDTIMSFQTI